jgi:chaperonin GroES
MNIKPIRDRILVKPEDKESVTASGIFIPDNAAEKPAKGKVLSVGTGRVTNEGNIIPMVIKEGDTVLYGKFSGQTVKISEIEHLILTEDDVMAVVE